MKGKVKNMTIAELRQHTDYEKAVRKIKNYSKGFRFTVNYANIPKAKANALKIILADCRNANLIESVSIGLSFDGNPVEETFIRI